MRREQKKFEAKKKKVLPRKSEGVAASTMLGERNKKQEKRGQQKRVKLEKERNLGP